MNIGDRVVGDPYDYQWRDIEIDGFIQNTYLCNTGPIHLVVWKGGHTSWVFEKVLLENKILNRDNILSSILDI